MSSGLEITKITDFGDLFSVVVHQERLGIHGGFRVRSIQRYLVHYSASKDNDG